MKLPSPLAHFFIVVSVCFTALSAQAESYRFMNVEVRGVEGARAVTKALGDPKTWPAFATQDGTISLKNIIAVNIGPDGTGSFDETYPLKYAQSFDEADQPKDFTTRKIGVQASVKKLDKGTAEIRLTFTSLERWVPSAPGKNTLQPILATREMSSVAKLPTDETPAILGGQTREVTGADGKPEKVSTVLIVQRFEPVPESAEPPATSAPSFDPFRAGK